MRGLVGTEPVFPTALPLECRRRLPAHLPLLPPWACLNEKSPALCKAIFLGGLLLDLVLTGRCLQPHPPPRRGGGRRQAAAPTLQTPTCLFILLALPGARQALDWCQGRTGRALPLYPVCPLPPPCLKELVKTFWYLSPTSLYTLISSDLGLLAVRGP